MARLNRARLLQTPARVLHFGVSHQPTYYDFQPSVVVVRDRSRALILTCEIADCPFS